MLVQPADDGDGSAIVFAAWPCSWDVDFKLAAPYGTTIEAALKGMLEAGANRIGASAGVAIVSGGTSKGGY